MSSVSLAKRVVNIKELPMKKCIVAIAIVLSLLWCVPAFAQRQVELIPAISVSGTYDDNIDLENTNEKSDYITAATPSLTLNVLSQNTRLGVTYAPSFVWYADYDDNDNTRHLATANWEQQLTQHLSFRLTDTYLNSEDPLEDTLDVQGIRRTRNKYWVNTFNGSFGYVFGKENSLNVGYRNEYRKNDEITLDDSIVHTPFADVTYWFDVKNGIALTYTYTDVEYSRDDDLRAEDDYSGHAAGLRYNRRFSPHSTAYIGYRYTTREYDGFRQDYEVHDGYVGLDHAFSPEYTFSGSVGYFIRVNEITDNEDGPTFTLSLTRTFSRGSITVGGDGGWYEEYLQQSLGGNFRQYYGGFVRGTYQLLERLSLYAGATYRYEKDQLDITSDFITANCGLTWTFLRWFSLTLDYRYADRNDDIAIDSYTDNRVMLILRVSKPYKW